MDELGTVGLWVFDKAAGNLAGVVGVDEGTIVVEFKNGDLLGCLS